MSNVHGLYSAKKEDDDENKDDENNRYVGGIGDHGGGSGLAVQPNTDEDQPGGRDSLFAMAENASAEESSQARRTITMYRDGFTVDDGPYRRLNDPANAEFLRALAMGRTPPELSAEAEGGNVTVGLVDKRDQDYVEEFRSFSGAGNSLGAGAASSTTTATNATFDPTTLPAEPPALNDSAPATSIQVRLANGQRRVIRINLASTVADLAAHLRGDAEGSFRLASGFPPKPLKDASATVEAAGLKGAQVSMQKA